MNEMTAKNADRPSVKRKQVQSTRKVWEEKELGHKYFTDWYYRKRRNFCWGLIFMGKHPHKN